MTMPDPDEPRAERSSERPRISAPPPDFDDDPVLGATKQTPKEELAHWRALASRDEQGSSLRSTAPTSGPISSEPGPLSPGQVAHDGPTRVLQSPSDGDASFERVPDAPTRELDLSSDVIALARRPEPTGRLSLPPRAPPPPRPALLPTAGSIPPENVPMAPPIGVSVPPGMLSQSLPAPRRRASRRPQVVIAFGVLVLALAAAGILVLWPRQDRWGDGTPIAPPPSAAPAGVTEVALPPSAPRAAPSAAAPTPVPNPAPSIPASPIETASSTALVEAPSPSPSALVEAPSPLPPALVEAPSPSALIEALAAPSPATGSAPVEGPAAADEAAPAADASPDELIAAAGLLEEGNPTRALSIYQEAIALDGHDPYAFAGAARCALALGRAGDAVRYAERAVANRRLRATFRVLLGDAHAANGDEARARQEWEQALALDPDDDRARARLGN